MPSFMIPVYCRTNLDLAAESWPLYMPAVPRVGDEIQSMTTHETAKHGTFQLSLQVVSVTWKCVVTQREGEVYMPFIELHMTEFQKRLPGRREGAETGSIIAFYEWYAPLVGRNVSAFI